MQENRLNYIEVNRMRIRKSSLTISLLILAFFQSCTSLNSAPDELIGTWTTEAQEYRGIFFKLNKKTFVFSKKDGTVDNFSIVKIKRNRMKGEWVKFTIFYRDQQLKKFELPLLYHPHNSGTIRFMNREQNTWVRESS